MPTRDDQVDGMIRDVGARRQTGSTKIRLFEIRCEPNEDKHLQLQTSAPSLIESYRRFGEGY
jgi:hypothetical protein